MYPARRSSWRQASRDQLHFVVAVLRDCLPRASCVSEPCSRGKSGPAIARVSDRLSLFVWLHVGVAGDDPELRFDSSGAGSLILGEEKSLDTVLETTVAISASGAALLWQGDDGRAWVQVRAPHVTPKASYLDFYFASSVLRLKRWHVECYSRGLQDWWDLQSLRALFFQGDLGQAGDKKWIRNHVARWKADFVEIWPARLGFTRSCRSKEVVSGSLFLSTDASASTVAVLFSLVYRVSKGRCDDRPSGQCPLVRFLDFFGHGRCARVLVNTRPLREDMACVGAAGRLADHGGRGGLSHLLVVAAGRPQ